ncbi:MAG: hypothetical protein WBV23_10340 [Desulfobaccales bacterium]
MMGRIGGIIEGLILLAIGAYAGLLVIYGDYWRFLNPKFKWLTGLTAAMLILIGTIAIFKTNKRASYFRICIFLIFLGIIFWGNSGRPVSPKAHSKALLESPADAVSRGERLAEEKSRLALNGLEYIKINLGELYSLCQEPKPDKIASRYVVRGIVKRTKQTDRLGYFVLLRSAVVCCLADSVGVGFRVKYERLNELEDGQWVEVYGTLRSLSKKLPKPHLRIKEIRLTVLCDSHILVPASIVGTEEPETPFMFEFSDTEPYRF